VTFHFPIWTESEGFFTAEKSRLEAILKACGATDEEIQRRMGHGYDLLGCALDGVRLTQYEVQHVEWGIRGSSAPAAGNSMAGLPDLGTPDRGPGPSRVPS
jgi:hypothetical protein